MSSKKLTTAKSNGSTQTSNLKVKSTGTIEEIGADILSDDILEAAGFVTVATDLTGQDPQPHQVEITINQTFPTAEDATQYLKDQRTVIKDLVLVDPFTIDDPQFILDSKKYVKGATSYQSPREILAPCIAMMHQANGKISLTGTHESTNANADGTKNISWGRLNLVARWEIDTETFYEVGILAAYDLQSPKLKIYRGQKVRACTNLCIYQADDIVKFDISEGINQDQVATFLSNISAKINEVVEIANRLKAIEIPEKMMSEIIGKMMLNTVEQDTLNGTNSILLATKLFTDSKSKYYFRQPNFNGWQLFNGFTEHLSKANFFDIPEKTRDTFHLLKNICLS